MNNYEPYQLEAEEVAGIYRLVHELCEMGADAYAWRAHVFSRLLPMIDGIGGAAYVMKHPVDPAQIGPRTVLMMSIASTETWTNYAERGDLRDNPITPGMMQRMGSDFTCTRQELVDDEVWYRSDYAKFLAEQAGWDQQINSQVAISPPGYVNGFGFCRAPGQPAFGPREAALVRLLQGELARLWRRPDPLDIHTLPDRQREVLGGIRRGESRKQIADAMKVSDHTVHTYEKALFERAGVRSRGELLARVSGVIRPNLLP